MGAYEFAILRCELTAAPHRAILTWSSRADRFYSVSWSPDLRTWSSPVRVNSTSNTTTSWTDSAPPESAPCRFYRIQE
jgi:hypothetical protein